MIWAILCTGPSMSQAVADSVRGRCKVIAVSDSYKLAPWADLLVSADRSWWRVHTPEFAGRKFAAVAAPGAEIFREGVTGNNSGLLAARIAVSMGAKRVLFLGLDMQGTHFFGPHPEGLRNTTPLRFDAFKRQFAQYKPKGVELINCTPESALTCYPKMGLEDALSLT